MEMELHICSVLLMLLVFTNIQRTRAQDMVLRKFSLVNDTNIADNIDMSTRRQTVSTKMRCTSLCVQLGCQCTSFHYDNTTKDCIMFPKTLKSGTGNVTAYNKNTECATPQVLPDATLQTYTGCNATYTCNYGYTASASKDGNVITCQTTETWKPNDYICLPIPCPIPPSVTKAHFSTTSIYPGGTASYHCDINYINIGGGADTLTCLLGGTWSGNIDIVCIPAYRQYTITITTGSRTSAGTAADVYLRLTCQRGTFTIFFPPSTIFYISGFDTYKGTHDNVGDTIKVEIGHDGTGDGPGWFVAVVDMKVSGDGQESYFWNVNEWIDTPSDIVTVYVKDSQ